MSLNKPGDFITFDKKTFIENYFDKENDKPLEVVILNLPVYGVFRFDKKVINKVNFIFKIDDIDKLTYTRISNQAYTEEINFKTSDDNPNKKFSEMATMTINVLPYTNQPPDAVGDNSIEKDFGELVVFTQEDFTTNTVPKYDDPEGDNPYKLKILSLPSAGNTLRYKNTNVVIDQEILFSDIKLGHLTMITNSDPLGGDYSFNFAVSDTGSQQFTS